MKAVLIQENKALTWSDVPDPVMKEDEMLIEIHAAALNRADLLQRQGKYPSPEGCPPWMGLEISGKIVDMGETAKKESNWRIGDSICALLGGGGYAEYVSIRYDMAMPIPKGLSFEEAAALPEAYATSYLNLYMEGHLQPGQTAYIPAGAGGLSSVAIPMAKALGSRVITSVLSDELREKIRPLGADVIINSTTENVSEILKQEEAAGHPINVAMDCLCGALLGECIPYMAPGGYWIVISTLAGTATTIPLRALLDKGLHLVGSKLRNKSPQKKAEILRRVVKDVWPKIEDGTIRPCIYQVLPIQEAEAAHGILERGENIGKVVLHVREER